MKTWIGSIFFSVCLGKITCLFTMLHQMWRNMLNWKMFLCWRCVPLCSPGAVDWRSCCAGANGSSCNSKYLIFFMICIVFLLLLKMTSFTLTRTQCVSCKCLFCSWRIWQEWTRGDDVETSFSHTDLDRMACLCLELKINLFFCSFMVSYLKWILEWVHINWSRENYRLSQATGLSLCSLPFLTLHNPFRSFSFCIKGHTDQSFCRWIK